MSQVLTCAILAGIFVVLIAVFVSIIRQGGASSNMQMSRFDDRIRGLESIVTGMASELRSVAEGMRRTERTLDAIVHGALDEWAEGRRERS